MPRKYKKSDPMAPSAPRATLEEVAQRERSIDLYWLENPLLTKKDVVAWTMGEFGLKQRGAEDYVRGIAKRRRDAAEQAAELPMRKAEARLLLRDLIDEARQANQYGAAMVGARQLCRI